MSDRPARNYSIDFLRFLFSAIIVYYHILHSNIISYTAGQKLYVSLQEASSWAGLIVECFLIIGGYYLYRSAAKSTGNPFHHLFIDKFARLWPVLAFYVLFSFIFMGLTAEDAVFQLSFLHCTGLSLAYKGIIWYVGPFFWGSILLLALMRVIKKRPAAVLLGVLAFLGYSLNINHTGGGLGREVVFSFISLGLLRVISGLCVGALIGMFNDGRKHASGIVSSIIWTLVEILTLGFLIKIFVIGKGSLKNSLIVILAFIPLFYSFINTKGYLSKILNRPLFGFAGRYSYSIYVMQQISFFLLSKTFWKNTDFLYSHALISILISLVVSIAIGIITYYAIERPAIKVFKKLRRD